MVAVNEMKDAQVVILAGGRGTRLSEKTDVIPKPMLDVGGKPLLMHIMDIYGGHGVSNFIIASGYKREAILAFFLSMDNVLLMDKEDECVTFVSIDWTVRVVDTGLETQTGGRLRRLRHYVTSTFFLTYGDGVGNIDISDEWFQHNLNVSIGAIATVTAVRPVPRFGAMDIKWTDSYGFVQSFGEKELIDGWINGGFFVLEPNVIDFIRGDGTNFESDVLPKLAEQKSLFAYKHTGFWKCVDTLRDLNSLKALYDRNGAVWLE